jgi:hypothetical protein
MSRERFFKTLKTEQIYGNKLISQDKWNSIYSNSFKSGITIKESFSLDYKTIEES